jgi:hypothetical protein
VARATAWIFERNGNAVAALLLAIAGLIGFGLVLGPTAVVLGLLARSQIAATGRPGIRLASAGIALGVVAFVLPIVRVST